MYFPGGPPEPPGDLLVCGLASELCREFIARARRFARLLPGVYRQSNGASLVFYGTSYGLSYPLGGVG